MIMRILTTGLLLSIMFSSCKTSLNMINDDKEENKDGVDFISALHDASYEGDVKGIKRSIRYGDKINLQDGKGNTPLHLATENKHIEAIQELLSSGADRCISNFVGNLPLHIACEQGDVKSVELLFTEETVNTKNNEGQTPVHMAASNKHERVINLLRGKEADIAVSDNQGRTILYTLMKSYFNETNFVFINDFISDNPNALTYVDDKGASLLHIAATLGDIEVAEHLISLNKSLLTQNDKEGKTFLDYAARSGKVQFVEKFMERREGGIDVNVANASGMNALHESSLSRNIGMVKSLISKSIDIGKQDNSGKTALHYACLSGSIEVVKEMLFKLKDANQVSVFDKQDNEGDTPLHLACRKGYHDIVDLLLQQGCKPNIINNECRTALHTACISGDNVDIVDLLLRYDARPQLKDNATHTALYYAIIKGHKECVKILQKKGSVLSDGELDEKEDFLLEELEEEGSNMTGNFQSVDKDFIDLSLDTKINWKDKKSLEDALFKSIDNGYDVIADFLTKVGTNVNFKDKDGRTLLHLTAVNDKKEVAEMLIKLGADVNVKDNIGRAPLHLAAANGNIAIAEMLIKLVVDVNVKDNIGRTPLHLAAANGNTAMAEMLIKWGADVNFKDNVGWTPLHSAARECKTEVAGLLIKFGDDVNARENGGRTPLNFAKKYGSQDLVNLLLRHGGRE